MQEDVKEVPEEHLQSCLVLQTEKDQGHILSSTGYNTKVEFIFLKPKKASGNCLSQLPLDPHTLSTYEFRSCTFTEFA